MFRAANIGSLSTPDNSNNLSFFLCWVISITKINVKKIQKQENKNRTTFLNILNIKYGYVFLCRFVKYLPTYWLKRAVYLFRFNSKPKYIHRQTVHRHNRSFVQKKSNICIHQTPDIYIHHKICAKCVIRKKKFNYKLPYYT